MTQIMTAWSPSSRGHHARALWEWGRGAEVSELPGYLAEQRAGVLSGLATETERAPTQNHKGSYG